MNDQLASNGFPRVLKASDALEGAYGGNSHAGWVEPQAPPTFGGPAGAPGKEASRLMPAKGSPPLLDPLKHNRNTARPCSCGRWSVGTQEKIGFRYVRLGCKRWTCPRCGPRKAKRVKHAIIKQAQSQDLRRFLTLTLDPRKCTAKESVPYIKKVWGKMRVSLKRKLGSSPSFIAILELQKSGYAHLHVLVSCYIPQQWISSAWQGVGGGRIVDIRHVDVHRIVPYLAKYLTKELLLTEVSRKARRFTTSRDIRLFEKTTTGTWTLVKYPLELLRLYLGALVVQEIPSAEGELDGFISLRRIEV